MAGMTQVSVRSLRLNNPDANIVLLCDQATATALTRLRHPLIQEVHSLISVTVPDAPASYRNRMVKTSMRRHVHGPFLYLDADTIVRSDLSPVFRTGAQFAGAANFNGSGSISQIPNWEKSVFGVMDWRLPSQIYVNGGVLFFSDHPRVHEFCELWHKKWLTCSARTGRPNDQPSLNSAIGDSQIELTQLDDSYNAQVFAKPSAALDAAVWHFYHSMSDDSPKTVMDNALSHLKCNRRLAERYLAKLVQSPHPWPVGNPLDWLAIRGLQRQTGACAPNCWERSWLADKYVTAGKHFLLGTGFAWTVPHLARAVKGVSRCLGRARQSLS